MAAQTNVHIYGNGLFQDQSPPYPEQLRQMVQARFDTVTLWALRAHKNGDLYYNDNLAVRNGALMTGPGQLNPRLPDLLAALRGAGGLRTLSFSIGPLATDFRYLAADAARAAANLRVLIAALDIDSIDFDYEGDYSDSDQRMLVELTLMLRSLGVDVTYCPYTAEEFWLGCLTEIHARQGRQLVARYNLQCHDGGGDNDPVEWARTLQQSSRSTGIADPYAFVQPGYRVMNTGPNSFYGKCPNAIENTFAALSAEGICGGWLWNAGDVFANEQSSLCPGQDVTPAGYGCALARGLAAGAAMHA
ncbi:MAG TPA: hypothetical protein VI111_08525 [Thermoleophilaceae bacterium]